jgi:hypothetical protein
LIGGLLTILPIAENINNPLAVIPILLWIAFSIWIVFASQDKKEK